LESGDRVSAIVPIYSGKNLISGRSPAELAAMARTAQGVDGKCIDYARNIAVKLAELGIEDPEVEEFWRAVK
jgi:cation transport regulator ChaC